MIDTDINNKAILEKEGYKETKLGLIPEDWSVCTFGDIADKKVKWSITGGPFGSNLKAEHYRDEGIRIIQLQNIGDGEFRDNSKIYTSLDKADELLACNIFPGEIILSKMGDPVARACKIPSTEKRWVMGSDGIRLVVDESKYDKRFVLDYINYSIFRNLAISRSTGSTRRRIGLVDLKKIPFIKLPLTEQQKIAKILNTWDKAILAQEKLIAEKQELKNGLMQQLLTGKKRFSGFTEDWKTSKLGDIFTIQGRVGWKGYKKEDLRDEGPLVIGAKHIKNQLLNLSDPTHLSLEKYEESPEIMIKINDLLIVQRGSLGKIAIIENDLGKATINPSMAILRPKRNDISVKFIYYFLCSDFSQKLIMSETGSTGVPMISQKQIGTFKMHYPSIQEQDKIVDLMQEMDKELLSMVSSLQNLNKQKQGLMQQLLTGEKRVKI